MRASRSAHCAEILLNPLNLASKVLRLLRTRFVAPLTSSAPTFVLMRKRCSKSNDFRYLVTQAVTSPTARVANTVAPKPEEPHKAVRANRLLAHSGSCSCEGTCRGLKVERLLRKKIDESQSGRKAMDSAIRNRKREPSENRPVTNVLVCALQSVHGILTWGP